MNEITEVTSETLERAAQLGRARVERAYRGVLGNGAGLMHAQAESLGNGVYLDGDGDEVEYFGAGMVVGATQIKARR